MPDEFGLPSYTPTSSYGSTWGTGNGLAAAAADTGGGGGGNMWLTAGVSILSSLGASGSAKKAAKQKRKDDWAMQERGAVLSRTNETYSRELDRYYTQLNRTEKKRGLDQFRQFSSVKQFAPNFVDSGVAPTLPSMPNPGTGAYAPAPLPK